jgi:hypothetical protein
MDIIAAHQQGLIEQLDAEVEALAGRALDHGQRAVVLHHLYDHSRGGHEWAIAEARRSLRIASRLARLERRLDRWGWAVRDRDEARAALKLLAGALGSAAKSRMAAGYRAYRLSATPALRGEAEAMLEPALLTMLDQCHAARRESLDQTAEARRELADANEALAAAVVDIDELARAWAAIDRTALRRSARRLLSEERLARGTERDRRKGWPQVERMVRNHASLPASFRANPAQHFYALQRTLTDRRRQQWRELCDLEPDAVALAA